VQLEMPFESAPERTAASARAEAGAGDRAPEAADAGPGERAAEDLDDARVGILSERPWRAAPAVVAGASGGLRRAIPLTWPVSDRLLHIMASRGLARPDELEQFFFPTFAQLPDPFALEEMEPAVARLLEAARREQTVAVHGDFDVDGITGCALLTILLGHLSVDGARPRLAPPFVPDRHRDGYGIAERMIHRWAAAGVSVLVTVDAGASALEELALARRLGLDVIVLDHHLCSERPPVTAFINPRRPGGTHYPNPDLCGVGVAFKLLQALRRAAPGCLPPALEAGVTDLVALGLVADQMTLLGENRALVRIGLARLAGQQRRPGLAMLLQLAGLGHGFPLTAGDLAYQVAPRLNACGRIGRVTVALELLLTDDAERARILAGEADRTNRERRIVDQRCTEEALTEAERYLARGDRGLVLASPQWHKGIIGIGASRLVERLQVPTILVAVEGEEARGSARTTASVDIKAVLDRCAGLLDHYGGHCQAAGLTLRTRDLAAFREAFLAVLASLPPSGPLPQVYDLALPLDQMTAGQMVELLSELEHLEPHGPGNRRPLFQTRGLQLSRPPQPLGDGSHLRFAFKCPAEPPAGASPALLREFVSFGSGPRWREWLARQQLDTNAALARRWDILFQISRSNFQPRDGVYDPVQQQLIDIRPASGS
jgi:single-stranded-DNA-specific exonuclease